MTNLIMNYNPETKTRTISLDGRHLKIVFIIKSLCEPIECLYFSQNTFYFNLITSSKRKINLIDSLERRYKIIIQEVIR